jgi:TonB-linked SusC/RagA family outer membrane protein
MKSTKLILLIHLFLAIPNLVRAQMLGDNEKVVLPSLDMNANEIFEAIQKQTDWTIAYSEDVLPVGKFHFEKKNQTVKSLLDLLENKANLEYKKSGKQITVRIASQKISDPKIVQPLRKVTGVVRDASGVLPGVNVHEKNNFQRGASTNENGVYQIEVTDSATILVYSFIGMNPTEIKVGAQAIIDVTLEQAAEYLDEVVVVGYGTANKRDLTGSIVKLDGSEVLNTPNPNPISSLQGRVTGLSIVNSGVPGAAPDVRIRGTTSLSQTGPLYVVDGIFADNIFFLSPGDIESLEVLKDPSSLAVFGVRGANGVIIITTKKGKEGQLVVNANFSYGVKSIVSIPQLTDRDGFITLNDENRFNQRLPAYPKYGLYTANTNWIDQIKQTDALVTNNNISLSSGTEKNKFYMGFGYTREQGLIKYEDYSKFTLSVSDELKVNKSIRAGFNVSAYQASLPLAHDFGNALKAPPIVEPFNVAQNLYNRLPEGLGGNDVGNPLQQIEITKNTAISKEYNFRASTFIEVTFFKAFTYHTNLYANFYLKDYAKYTPLSISYNLETQKADTSNLNTSVYQDRYLALKYQQEHLLTYKKQFGDHGLTLLGGFTTYFESASGVNGSVQQYRGGDPIPNDPRWWYLNVFPYGDPTTRVANSSQNERANLSYLFRALYNFKDKYLLNTSYRRDGSSAISPNHRFQDFWALGFGWVVTEEIFFQNQKLFNNLKLKASVGQLGNQFTGLNYPYYPNYQNGSVAVFGNNIVPALELAYRNDPNLRWETVEAYEGGVEANLLRTRLKFEANYYSRKTKDLLTQVNDGSQNFYTNAGSVRSSGIELSATWNSSIRTIGYSLSGNVTTIDSEVLSVWKPGYSYTAGSLGQSRTEAGYPIGYFYGYSVEGLDNKGNFKFKDVNRDGVVNASDRTYIGNPTPKFIYGFTVLVDWQGFDLNISLQGVYGNQVWRNWGNEGAGSNIYNYRIARLGRWQGDGASEPQQNTSVAANGFNSDYMVEDGSYIRIRNLQLGYTVKPNLLEKAHIKALRIFIGLQNPITWQNNSGFTPEASNGNALSFGIDNGGYPLPSISSIGFNLTF